MARSCTTAIFALIPATILGEGSEQDLRQREEIGWIQGTIPGIEPSHDSCFSFQWCYRPYKAPHSGPHQNCLLVVAQPAISQKLCYCYQGIFIFLGLRQVGSSLTADEGGTPRWEVQCQQFWKQVTHQGLKMPISWNKHLCLFLLHYNTWEKDWRESPPCVEWQ